MVLDHPAFQHAEGEIDVPVRAGDVVIGDSRMLHAAHGNRGERWRSLLTIWYWPAYDDLPEEVQALVARHITDVPEWSDWVTQTQSITRPLIPVYHGDAEPPPWRSAPGAALR